MNIFGSRGPSPFAPLALAVALVVPAIAVQADDAPAAAGKTERCLLLNRIRHTKVVDEKTVLFYLSNNDVYRNDLPHPCGQLRSDEGFLYKSSINQLCSVDTITPLVRAGGGYMATASCGLGKFTAIDKAGAEKLLSDAKAARAGD